MPIDRKNLGIVEGGYYAKRDPSPELECRREVRERIVAWLTGKRKPRQLECVAGGVTNPMGEPLKLMRTLKDARVGFDASWRITLMPQARSLAAMHGRTFDSGEFEPPPEKKAA